VKDVDRAVANADDRLLSNQSKPPVRNPRSDNCTMSKIIGNALFPENPQRSLGGRWEFAIFTVASIPCHAEPRRNRQQLAKGFSVNEKD
jgi:hypothetical protein